MTVTDSTPRIQAVQTAKVTDAHQAKLAIVYVRQSSQRQVLDHQESRERQYGLADHAVALGGCDRAHANDYAAFLGFLFPLPI